MDILGAKTVYDKIMLGNGMEVDRAYYEAHKEELDKLSQKQCLPPTPRKQPDRFCPMWRDSMSRPACTKEYCALWNQYDKTCGALACKPFQQTVCPYNSRHCCGEMCAAYRKE